MAAEGAAGTSAIVGDEARLEAATGVGLMNGTKTGDGTETGLVALTEGGSRTGAELEAGADVEAGVMAGAAASF